MRADIIIYILIKFAWVGIIKKENVQQFSLNRKWNSL